MECHWIWARQARSATILLPAEFTVLQEYHALCTRTQECQGSRPARASFWEASFDSGPAVPGPNAILLSATVGGIPAHCVLSHSLQRALRGAGCQASASLRPSSRINHLRDPGCALPASDAGSHRPDRDDDGKWLAQCLIWLLAPFSRVWLTASARSISPSIPLVKR